jgi:hypothetical protein
MKRQTKKQWCKDWLEGWGVNVSPEIHNNFYQSIGGYGKKPNMYDLETYKKMVIHTQKFLVVSE